MANQPFDTTIINPLERPKSSDINAAQSELHRDLRDYLLRAYAVSDGAGVVTATAQTGFVGRGFVVEPTSPSASMNVTIAQGIGFQATLDSTANVGSIVGLNDLSYYKPMLLSGSQLITVPTAPAAGFCRRDLIEVRYNRKLTDLTTSDVYNVVSQVFTSQNINKTMTFDLINDVQYIAADSLTAATASIVYRSGVEVAYSTPDSFLSAPIHSTDSGYVAIAVINVGPNYTSINQYSIADWRPVLSNDGTFDITGSATLGGADLATAAGQQLLNVKVRAPKGIRCAVSKVLNPPDLQNSYVLSIFTPDAVDVTAVFTPHMPLSIYNSGSSSYTTKSYPVMVATQTRQINAVVDRIMQIDLANSATTSPDQFVAVGQVVQRVYFSVGAVRDPGVGDYYYLTDTSVFTVGGGATQTVDVSFHIRLAV